MDNEIDYDTSVEVHAADDNNNDNNKDAILYSSDVAVDGIDGTYAVPNVYESINDNDEVDGQQDRQNDDNDDGYQDDVERGDAYEVAESYQAQQTNEDQDTEQEQEQTGDNNESGSYELSGGVIQSDQADEDRVGDEEDDDDVAASRHVDYQAHASDEDTAEAFGQSFYDDTAVRYEQDEGTPDDYNETGMFSVSSVNDTESPSPASAVSPVAPASPVPVARTTTAAPTQRNANPSGKFVMRSSRQQDATSFINIIRQAVTSDAAQSDELMTAIRNTVSKLEEQKSQDRKSVVKEVFVSAYEKNVLSGATSPISPPVVTSYVDSASTKPTRRPTPAVLLAPDLKVAQPINAVVEEERTDEEPSTYEAVSVQLTASAESAPEVKSRDLDIEVNFVKSPVSRDQPVWLNDALEKQKRSADVIQTLEKSASETNATSSQSPSAPPPWIKDRIVKRSFTLPVNDASAVPVAMAASPEQPSPAAETKSSDNGVDKIAEPSPTQSATPLWKADIESRKKLKAYVVAQKPEQPIRLGTVPDWKRQLSEKSKIKKAGEDGPLSAGLSGPDSPWKRELAQLRQQSVSSPDDEIQNVPEWLRLAEEKQNATPATNGVK